MKRALGLQDLSSVSNAEKALSSLREWIRNGDLPPGKRLPSERSLAKRIGVSRALIRSALRELDAHGLVKSMPRRVRVVVGPRANGHNSLLNLTVAVLVGNGYVGSDLGHADPMWLTAVHRSIAQKIIGAGLGTLFLTENHVTSDTLEFLPESPPRGLIAVSSPPELQTRERLLEKLHIGDVPVVAWADEHEWPGCDVVKSDHESGSYELTRWVVSQGCRRLLRVRPVLKPIPDWLRRRDIGHERALREAGLPILPPLDVAGLVEAVNDASLFGQMTHLLAGHLFGHLSTGQPVDALLAVSDGHLAEVAGACRILGKDPASDVVLTGYDNCWKECPEFQWEPTPPRATVDKRDVAIGENLAEMLLSRLNRTRSAAPQSRLVPQTLVVV